jgi:DNA end-binding protein Ku
MVPAGEHEQDADENAAGSYADDDEEIAQVPRPQNTRTIEIERFIPTAQIDARYFEKPYYIVPREEIAQDPSPSSATR